MGRAVELEPPPFDATSYGQIYEDATRDAKWLAVSLITNAEREGDGARRLWSLSACTPDPDVHQLLKRHAVDESRHSLMYLAMLDLVFPRGVDPAFRKELNRLSPRFSLRQQPTATAGSPYAKVPTIDEFVQMNIAEIRTTIHHVLQRAAIAQHCPDSARGRVASIQDSLLHDELRHVAYTAVLIERLADDLPGLRLGTLFQRRVRDFNRVTKDELGDGIFD